MKIQFENVGRNKLNWTAEYPITATLENICEDWKWWCNQLAKALRSDPEWVFNEKENCVDIFAGWHHVGTARIATEGGAA